MAEPDISAAADQRYWAQFWTPFTVSLASFFVFSLFAVIAVTARQPEFTVTGAISGAVVPDRTTPTRSAAATPRPVATRPTPTSAPRPTPTSQPLRQSTAPPADSTTPLLVNHYEAVPIFEGPGELPLVAFIEPGAVVQGEAEWNRLRWVEVVSGQRRGYIDARLVVEPGAITPNPVLLSSTTDTPISMLDAPNGAPLGYLVQPWDRVAAVGPPTELDGTWWLPVGNTRPGFRFEIGWVDATRLAIAWYEPRTTGQNAVRSFLNLRASPNGDVVGQVLVGERFVLFGNSTLNNGLHWHRIETEDRRTGWIASLFATDAERPSADPSWPFVPGGGN